MINNSILIEDATSSGIKPNTFDWYNIQNMCENLNVLQPKELLNELVRCINCDTFCTVLHMVKQKSIVS